MASLLVDVRRLNGWGRHRMAEPFAGGAGASLAMLMRDDAPGIDINDADPAIHAFWWSLLQRPKGFLARLDSTPVSMRQWERQRALHHRAARPRSEALGFSTFYLNRCNRSGIILKGGPIGGTGQTGKWKLDARYNKAELRGRCEDIIEQRDRITITNDDGLEFIRARQDKRTFFFIDPPYYHKGPTLYLNSLNHEYHEALAKLLRDMTNQAWVLTYDDAPEVRQLYESWATVRPFKLDYAASKRRRGSELLICPAGTRLPQSQESNAIDW